MENRPDPNKSALEWTWPVLPQGDEPGCDLSKIAGGGAKVKRDEVDSYLRRHITLTDSSGIELLRAVLVPFGQTDGLPESPQQEIAGTLTPANGKKGKGPKVDMEPGVAAGPAVRRDPDGKWRVERSSNGTEWHTIESGTSTACLEKYKSPGAREGGAWLRVVRPDGTTDKIHEGKNVGMSARDKKNAKPASKKSPKRLETNVTPVGARKPVKPPKPTPRAKAPAKKGAKRK